MIKVGRETYVDIDHAVKGLEKFKALIELEIDKVIYETGKDIHKMAKIYDAPPTDSYQRTGEMKKETRYRKVPGGIKVGVYVPWAGYVRGGFGRRQAWMHEGRWIHWVDITGEKIVMMRKRIKATLAKVKKEAFK